MNFSTFFRQNYKVVMNGSRKGIIIIREATSRPFLIRRISRLPLVDEGGWLIH